MYERKFLHFCLKVFCFLALFYLKIHRFQLIKRLSFIFHLIKYFSGVAPGVIVGALIGAFVGVILIAYMYAKYKQSQKDKELQKNPPQPKNNSRRPGATMKGFLLI